jgi:DNA-binding NarL/FixJ family response regulator
LGAWNAITHELVSVTNTTVVNTETICELLRKITTLGLTGPITLVLDNARYQRNATVQALANQLGMTLLFLPPYSPNLNLIERLWRFLKREHARLLGTKLAAYPRRAVLELPPRLREVLKCLMKGDGEKQIAGGLGISPHTVHYHIKELYRRFEAASRGELLAAARPYWPVLRIDTPTEER